MVATMSKNTLGQEKNSKSGMNWQVFSLVFTIASGVTIGILMTLALVLNFSEIPHIIGTVVAGLILCLPVTYIVAKKLQSLGITRDKSATL